MNEHVEPVVLTDENRQALWLIADDSLYDHERGSVQNGGVWVAVIGNVKGEHTDLPVGAYAIATNTYGQREEHWFPRYEAAMMWAENVEVGEGDE